MTALSNFGLPPHYRCRESIAHHDDRKFAEEWQDEVYGRAQALAREHDLGSILDIGCGSGFKLNKYFADRDVIGWELPPALGFLQQEYPSGHWELSDLSRLDVPRVELVLCCDVVEHLLDPESLMRCLARFDCRFMVLSTPARDLLAGDPNGPPRNHCHVREWTFEEFGLYVSSHFSVVEHAISNRAQATQYVIARGKSRDGGRAGRPDPGGKPA